MKISKIIELIKNYPDAELRVIYTNEHDEEHSKGISGVIVLHGPEGEVSVSLNT